MFYVEMCDHGGATVDEVQHKVQWVLLGIALAGCMGPHDTVLMADSPATTMSASEGGAGAKSASSGGAGSGTSETMAPGSSASGGSDTPSGGSTGSGTTMHMSAGGSVATMHAGAGGVGGTGGATGAAGEEPSSMNAGAGGMAGEGGKTPSEGATDADCDFTGVWMAQQLTVSQAIMINATSNNWYFLEFKQIGSDVVVSNEFDCGIDVESAVKVTITRATLEGELPHNRQNGRKATLKKVDGKCVFDSERFWSVRGAVEDSFVPPDGRASMMSIPDIAKARPLPTMGKSAGAIDTENDGKPGIAFQAAGIVSGTRNSVQRDWTRWFTDTGYEITPAMEWSAPLKLRADFDNEENVLDDGGNSLLSSGSTPTNAKHELRLRFLGRDRSDSRAMAIIKQADVDTCYAIQDAMPPEQLQ
jgi:hypothetical protein